MAEYFDVDHANAIRALGTRLTARTEWPTWLLIAAIYGGWLAVLAWVRAGTLPFAAAAPLLVGIATWQMSLQHELMHGHPTRIDWLNRLLASPPLAIWYPYPLYRDTHLAHHRDEDLTMPGVDPEGNYVPRGQWAALPRWLKALWVLRKTFLGRLLVGPPMSVAAMAVDALRRIRGGDRATLRMWLAHGAAVAALLAAVQLATGIAWWAYLLAVSWPALSLAMVRSLYEHRAAVHPKARIVVNEAGFAMRLLFLNNNYHLVHHDLPGLPWFDLPRAYRMRQAAYAEKCGGFVIRGGYLELLRRYAWRPTDAPEHPFRHASAALSNGGARIAVIDGCLQISS
ncbi:fatty acid desaturase [Burkholderia sp. Ac-20379]|uniref:fatty acid desaturase n=1 Tax=Burkholderia sp. Ac-20379 TaxID=2703900 RepID=UPI00197E7519|nr:fatty acid desaturase [Burkholderia sp. Ac-20379]MBN3729036.1 fatty acid desaturase [Burkholderia sp. Ac-20379]